MLLDYISMIGNFDPGYMATGFYPSGYFGLFQNIFFDFWP